MHLTTTSSLHNVRASAIGRPSTDDPSESDADVTTDNEVRADSHGRNGISRSAAGRLMAVFALVVYLASVAVLIGEFSLCWRTWLTSLCRLLGYR
jgi:hypothetical protein